MFFLVKIVDNAELETIKNLSSYWNNYGCSLCCNCSEGKSFLVITCCIYIIGGLICVNMIYWFA